MIAEPPLDDGAVNATDTDNEFALAVAVTPVGAPGKFGVVTLADEELYALTPAPFVAFTLNVYAVPGFNPNTVTDV